MLKRCIQAENRKLHVSPIWGLFFALPLISAIYGTFNYLQNLEILKDGWYSLWTQHTLFTCYFFLPIMIGIYSSYIMRQEENNRNWNKVLSMPVSKNLVFIAKLVQVFSMILFSEIWICDIRKGDWSDLCYSVGEAHDLVPFRNTWRHSNRCHTAYDFPFYQELCTSRRNRTRRRLIRTGVPCKASGAYLAYGMNSNAPQELLESGYVWFVVICIVYIVLFMTISSMILSRRDI